MFGTILVTFRSYRHVAARGGSRKTEVHMAEQAMGSQSADQDQDPESTAYSRLSEAQAAALRELAAGKPFGEAAAAAGVDRGTLYRWRTEDEDFIDALFEWRDETHAYCRDRMLSIADKAIGAVETGLEKGDARLAFRLLVDINRKTPQEREERQRREKERRRIENDPQTARLRATVKKCVPGQLSRIPELLGEIVEIDKARQKLEPGEYIVIEHKMPPGAFVIRSDAARIDVAPPDAAPAGDTPMHGVSSDVGSIDPAPAGDRPAGDAPSGAQFTDDTPVGDVPGEDDWDG
jgi:hypothetical protein